MANQDLALNILMQATDQSSPIVQQLGSALNSAKSAAAQADAAMKSLGVSQASAAIAIKAAADATSNNSLSQEQIALSAAKAEQAISKVGVAQTNVATAAQKAQQADAKLGSAINDVTSDAEQGESKLAGFSVALGGMGSAIGGIMSSGIGLLVQATQKLVSFGQQSVQVAAQYQQSMNMIQALTGSTNQQMQQYDTGVKQLASDTGVAATQLSGGLYNMISAGYSGSDAMKMLTLSTKDSVIGMTDATTTSNALTTVMRGFGVSIQYADSVNGQMIRTVTAGKMTMQDYAGAVSKTSSTAVQYKDTMVDMNSVLATLTSNGIKSAAIAGTDYDNLLKVLNGDTQKVAEKAQALNPAFNANSFAAMNVADKVKYLNSMIVEHGHQITDVMGKQQNAEAAFTILANNAKMYGDNLKNLGDAQANANATQAAWAVTQQGFQVSMDRVNASVQNVMITVGSAFLPVLSQLMTAVANIVSGFTSWIQQSGILQNVANGLSAVFTQITSVVQGVVNTISGSFMDLPNQANTWGSNMMDGFINGVESAIGDLIAIMDSVSQEVANFIGFASPSKKGAGRNLMTWGPAMIQSFAQGIVASGSSVQDAVAQVAQIAANGLQGVDGGQAGASAGGSFASGMSSSSVSISSGLQSVSLGHPFGMSASSGGTSKAANPLTTALSTHATALAATTATHATALASSTHKHAAAVAAALAKHQAALTKHAASVAASTQKHADALAKHAATATATAARHQAAMVKHATTVAAALQRHEAVLTREAANQNTKAAKSSRASTKAGGGSTDLPTSGAASPLANGLQAVQQFAQGINNGTGSVTSAVNNISSSVKNGFKNAIAGVKPALDGAINAVKLSISSLIPMIKPTLQILGQIFLGLWSTLKTLGTVIGTILMPAFANLVSAIAPIITGLLKWVASSGAVKIAFAALGIAINVVATVIGIIVNVIAALIKFFSQTQIGIAIFQAVLVLLGVIGVAITAIAVIILSTMIPAFVAWVAGAIAVGIANVIAFAPIVLIVLAVIAVIAIVILAVKNWGAISTWLKNAWGSVGAFFKGVWDGIVKVFGGIGQWFHDRFTQAGDGVKAGGNNIVKSYQDFATKSIAATKWLYDHNTYIKAATDATVSWTKSATDWMANAWKVTVNLALQIWDGLKIGAQRTWKQISDVVTVAVTYVTAWLTTAWVTATNWLQAQWKSLSTFAAQAWKAVSDVFTQAWTTYISQPLTSLGNNIATWFSNMGTAALQSGKNFVAMLANGITAGAGWIYNAVTGIANTIWKTLGFHSPAKEGPGKDADKWMPNLIKMMSKDLDDGANDMKKSAYKVAGAIKGALNNPMNLVAATILTSAGVALPNYNAGTGQTIADQQPVATSFSSTSSAPLIGELHIHLDKDSGNDAKKHAQQVTQEVQKQLAKLVRGQAITPRNTSGGH